MRRPISVGLLSLLLAGPVLAQSLAELAEKEKARRKKTEPAAQTFTEEDLKKARGTSGPSGPTPGTGAAPAKGAGDASSPEPGDAKAEASWRARAEAGRQAVKSLETQATALDARIKELLLDTAPNPPDLFDPDRIKKREAEARDKSTELERVNAQLAAARAALTDLEETARKASIPPGWLR